MTILVEDDLQFANRIQSLLSNNNIPCTHWANYDDLGARLQRTRPNLMLMDLQIGSDREAGLDALRIIKSRYSYLKTIMLTQHLHIIRQAFRLGADGYLYKSDLELSIGYIRELMQNTGNVPMTDQVRRALVQSFQPLDYEIIKAINDRERQILLLAASDHKVPQIADKLNMARSAVETYMRNIRAKLDCRTVQGAVAKAFYYRILDIEELLS